MGRLKKIVHVGIMICLVAIMSTAFALQVDAANITYNLSELTSSNTAKTVTDGTAYSTTLTPSTDYKRPTSLVITAGDKALGESDYTYSPTTGKLSIQASAMYGDIVIYGQAVALKSISVPTIAGNFVVYETLSAVVTPADATVTYQWYRNSTAISGATSPTYTLTLADVGKEINVQVTGTGDYGGQKISTSNVTVSKKSALAPSPDDVTITNVTKNGGTNGSIVASSSVSLEYYDTVYETWRSLPARNKSAGEYQIRYAETTDTLPSESATVRIYEPCTAPVDTDITITHVAVAGGSTGKMESNSSKVLEYNNGAAWVPFPVSGLKAGRYQIRFAATTDYLASEAVYFYVKEPTTLIITPLDVSITHVATKGGATGSLKSAATGSAASADMECQVDGVWTTLPVTKLKAGKYQVRYAGTDTTFPSAACEVIVKEPADPPKDIKVTDVAVYGGNTGAIAGLQTAWQVSYDGTTWHDLTQTSLTGLSAGTYHFRTKATDYFLASETVSVNVRQPEITPEATIDYINGTLKNLVSGAEYIIENVPYTAKDGAISILENNLTGRSITIVKKGNGTTTNNSAQQVLSIPARPAVPDAPLMMGKTDTTVTVAFTIGLEYSIDDGKTWMTATDNSYTFTKLKANTAYTVYARVKAVEGRSFSSASAGTSVTTKKSSASAVPPKAVVATTITDTSITIQVVNGQEYRLGNEEWRTSPGSTITWSDLNEDTRYTIMTRTAETEDTMYSTSLSKTITTYTKLTITSWSVDYWKKAITGLIDGAVYSINGGSPITVDEDGMLDVEDYFGRTVKLRRLGSVETETVDSDPVDIAINSPVAAPTKDRFDPATDAQTTLNSIIIAAPGADLEYQVLDKNGVPISAWKSSTGSSIVFDGLEHSTPYLIQVSFKQTATQPKSNALISDPIYTKFYEDTPAAVIDTLGVRLTGLIANADYLVGGIAYTADVNGNIPIIDAWIDSAITVVKCGDNIKTVNSIAQTLILPKRAELSLSPIIGQVTYYGGNNGSIGGLTTEMEYSADGGATWIAVTTDTVTGLTAKDYPIRRKGTAELLFASEPQIVTVTVNTALADYKEQIKQELEQAYEEKVASERYTNEQLSQIRAILDAGMKNIDTSFEDTDDIKNAKSTIMDNIAQVPCANTPTADGKLVGESIVTDNMLQYPNDSDEVWGNVANPEGLDSDLIFVIEKLGQSATEELRAKIAQAVKDGTITSFDGTVSAADIATALTNGELKVGLDITLARDGTATDDFKGTYTVTILLPTEVQGVQNLCIVSVSEDGSLEYHPATVTGNYLAFDTDHFSIYGIVGLNTVAIAQQQMLDAINGLRDSLNGKDYSRDNWKKVNEAFDQAIDNVQNATTEDEVNDAWNQLINDLSGIKTKSSLGWLWILILILVVLIAIIIVCFLVWRVRYFDGEERVASEFHFWGTKVALLAWSKDGWVLDGWYHDPELTDRAENGFPMPWHGVKLYAKWEKVEILSTEEESATEETVIEEPVIAELPMPEETLEDAVEEVTEETVEESEEEPVEETSEPEEEAQPEEVPEEEPEVVAVLEEPTEEEAAEEAEEPVEPTEPEEPEAITEDAPDGDAVVPVIAEEEAPEEVAEEEPEQFEEIPEEESDAAPMPTEEEQPEETEELPIEEDAVPEEEPEREPDIIIGEENAEQSEETLAVSTDEHSYKDTRSYKAWLEFGEEDSDLTADEEEKQLEDGDEVQLFTDEKTGEKYHIRFNYSFRAKMAGLPEESKEFYRDLKNEFLTYKGVKSRISWKTEGVRKGRETIARFAVRENTLCVFLALDPDQYKDSKYVFESVKDIKAYEGVPMLIRVKSDLSCRKVKELIADIMQPREVKRLDEAPATDYSHLYDDTSTEARLREGQLRIWAEGPDAQVCASRAATATLHYLICPEVTAEEADALISDEMLDALLPPSEEILIVADQVQEISIEQLCKKFYVGDVVDVEALKDKGLMDPAMTYVKITATGEMTKKMTVCAHMFERTAAKMILLTGGDTNIVTE